MRTKKTESLTTEPARPRVLGTAATYVEARRIAGFPEEWSARACAEGGARTPGGRIDLDKVQAWVDANSKELEATKDQMSKKDQKLVEEIRKLRLKNDFDEGSLVSKAWVSERFQAAAGEVNAVRVRIESVEPVRLAEAAGDIPRLRVIYREGIDELMNAFLACGKHFE